MTLAYAAQMGFRIAKKSLTTTKVTLKHARFEIIGQIAWEITRERGYFNSSCTSARISQAPSLSVENRREPSSHR